MTMIVSALLASGCGPARRSDTAPVTGQVTLGGRPIVDGDIRFDPEDPRRGPRAARIERGHYAGQAPVGRNRVSITASGTTKNSPMVDGVRLPVNIVQARYNDATTLTADVLSGETNTLDFAVEADHEYPAANPGFPACDVKPERE
jgi:hypothetical protein